MSKELNYIIKRKNKIGKKLDNDQNLLEICGEYKSSDKQWFGWCEEYETLQSIENALKALEIIKNFNEIEIDLRNEPEMSLITIGNKTFTISYEYAKLLKEVLL